MKRQRKQYSRPFRPWDKTRIESEKILMKEYGLRRKKEIWKAEAILRKYRQLARNLAANHDENMEKTLIAKLHKYGLISLNAGLDDILALKVESLLNRRLQSVVIKRGLANTAKQARQFIVHGHIAVDEHRTRWPSALIPIEMENKISYYDRSSIPNFLEDESKKKEDAKKPKVVEEQKSVEETPVSKDVPSDEGKEEVKNDDVKEEVKEETKEKPAEEAPKKEAPVEKSDE